MQQQISEFEQAIKDEGAKKYLFKLLFLTIGYILCAYFGLSLAVSFDQITTIWPPTGIAIAALLIWGYHYAPGIFVGALMANIMNGTSPIISTTIGVGNTLEAVIAVFLIHRFLNSAKLLEKISGIIKFIILAGMVSTMIAATLGVISLWLGDNIATGQISHAWLTWWVGDMMGVLVIVPFIMAWRDKSYRDFLTNKLFDGTFIFVIIATVCLIVFSQPASAADITSSLVYLIFPLIIWASVRLLQIGAVTATVIVTIAAVWGTLAGTGPYSRNSSTDLELVLLHIFIFTIIVTGLILAVSVAERLKAEKELRKKALELEAARDQILHNIKWRKNLQKQMEGATSQINQILHGILEDRPKNPPK